VSTLAVNSVTDANGGNTATINSMTPTADSLQGFRNRIINGDMRIAQRGTAAVTVSGGFPVDRFPTTHSSDGAFSAQQDSSAPAGFNNSVKFTVTTADASIGATQVLLLRQFIEGNNIADLGWGTANAKTVTLSFWVRSSVTGTFGGSIGNNANDRYYSYSYSISSADTWEYKTVTIAGDTSGTWLTDTGIGIRVYFSLTAGADRVQAAGSWQTTGGFIAGSTGQVQLLETLNATWYITGVQLEVGSVATPFERRPYELALCQRYYEIVIIPTSTSLFVSYEYPSGWFNYWQFKQTKRTSPTVALGPSAAWVGTTAILYPGPDAIQIYSGASSFYIGSTSGIVGLTASAEL
jgi:hypothetical protein